MPTFDESTTHTSRSSGVRTDSPEARACSTTSSTVSPARLTLRTTFWTAVAYSVPVTFLVLRNSEYAILKWFAALEQVDGAPGLDLPALDCAATAASYGVESRHVTEHDDLVEALSEALASNAPSLVQVEVAPGMALA